MEEWPSEVSRWSKSYAFDFQSCVRGPRIIFNIISEDRVESVTIMLVPDAPRSFTLSGVLGCFIARCQHWAVEDHGPTRLPGFSI